jgi:L-fuconolactonase
VRIDSHQHFWQFDPIRDSWINDEMKIIQQDFLPTDLLPVLQTHGFDGCITVQSNQTEAENTFQLDNAANNDFIKGVVGWVDLRAGNVEERLGFYTQFPKLKGFRHVLQGEAQRDLMLSPKFMNGIAHLAQFGYTYDILIFPDQLQYLPKLLAAFPKQKFVLDHIAKPLIKTGQINDWKKNMEAAAQYHNLYCKISGMVTEADWQNWKPSDFTPYLDVVVDAFGTNRIMYGSDWPVCLVAGGYQKIKSIVTDYFSGFSKDEQHLFFGLNAMNFYNI